jgi:phenylalanyl-tRNA synthetase beta chain
MKISYNWIKSYVPDIPEPNRLADLFTYHICEVESVEKSEDGDFLFDLGILPNRAHDLLSHQGVARELCGLQGVSFKDPTPMYRTPASVPTELKVNIQSDKCRRYSARIVHNVKVGPSPDWMKKHLESIGQRSINNVVDATNIVMYDKGQPTHAFDLKAITNYELRITNAEKDQELKLVGREGIVAKLSEDDLVISSGGKMLALGGVKGGAESGVQDDTTDILIEVANFNPISTRKTARRLGIFTDSAKRFENDLSPESCGPAMFDLSALLVELFPDAQFEDIVDVYPDRQEKRSLSFSPRDISKKLGIEIPEKEIEKILGQYEYVYKKEGETYVMEAPPLRLDLGEAHDMVEEIGRVYGYDKVKPKIPKLDFIAKENEMHTKISEARNILIENGYKEVMTYAFSNNGDVEVLASASDKKFLRTNLSDGLKKSYEMNKLNAPLLGLPEIKIFEIGTVFQNGGESIHVASADKKGVKEFVLEEFTEKFHQVLGSHSPAARPDHSENLSVNSSREMKFKPWSQYPFISRDIAVWVPENVSSDDLKNIYHEFGTELLQGSPELFDQFTKGGKTSYAFRLIFQSYDRTLTDEEINKIMANITEKISNLGYEVR